MAFCTQCGSKVEEGAAFCTSCGARQEEVVAAPAEAVTEVVEVVEVEEPAKAEEAAKEESPKTAPASATAPAAVVASTPVAASAPAVAPAPVAAPKKSPALLIVGIIAAVAVIVACVCVVLLLGQEKSTPAPEPTPANGSAEVVEVEAPKGTANDDADAADVAVVDVLAADYVLPDSATHAYTVAELSGLSDYELFVARNEIFARHGRGFQREELQRHFGSKSWYHATVSPEAFSDSVLNATEKKNIETIKSIEVSHGSPYLA